MKRIISILAILMLLFSMTACKRPDDNEETANKITQVESLVPSTESESTADDKNESNTGAEVENKSEVEDTTGTETEINAETESEDEPEPESETVTEAEAEFEDEPKDGDIVETVNQMYLYSSIADKKQAADLIAIVTFNGENSLVIPDETASELDQTRVFTDQKVTVDRVIKGNAEDELLIRRIGGRNSDSFMLSNDPKLESGNTYLLFLNTSSAVKENDTKAYTVHSGAGGCFMIDENGDLITDDLTDEDVTALSELYTEE